MYEFVDERGADYGAYVDGGEHANADESNGCDNGHSAGQEVLVDTAASFKEIQIPLSWGHLAGMYSWVCLHLLFRC